MAIKKITTSEFIKRAKIVHGDKYDYSKSNYINSRTKISIICHKHGKFLQTPYKHTSGSGCNMCGVIKSKNKQKLTNVNLIKQFNLIHKNKYNYSLIDYKNNKSKVKIICPEHKIFEQTSNHHLKGRGCPDCSGFKKLTTKGFIEKSHKIHGSRYDYSLVKYKNSRTKVIIICPEHGEFEQTPNKHLANQGCTICNKSKGENKISNFLINNNINFIHQKRFKDCINKRPLPFDFYLPDYNLCIEYDGEQHFRAYSKFGGNKTLQKTIVNDQIKNEYCKNNNINLERVNYKNFYNLENKVKQILSINYSVLFPKFN